MSNRLLSSLALLSLASQLCAAELRKRVPDHLGAMIRPLVAMMNTMPRFPRWIHPGAQVFETLP